MSFNMGFNGVFDIQIKDLNGVDLDTEAENEVKAKIENGDYVLCLGSQKITSFNYTKGMFETLYLISFEVIDGEYDFDCEGEEE